MSFNIAPLGKRMSLLSSTWPSSGLTPLTLYFLPFLGSKSKHEDKYLALYERFYREIGRPLNVVLLRARASYFASVFRGQMAAVTNLNIIRHSLEPGDPLMVHGMSVGCFLHAIHLSMDHSCPVIYRNIFQFDGFYQKTIVGQVFDSPVYGGEAMIGLPKMVKGLTHSVPYPLLRSVASSVAESYFSFSPTFVSHMDSYIHDFIHQTPQVPTLSFCSTQDPLIDSDMFKDQVIDFWRLKMLEAAAKANDGASFDAAKVNDGASFDAAKAKDGASVDAAKANDGASVDAALANVSSSSLNPDLRLSVQTPSRSPSVRSHCFTDSEHVQHLRAHPELYAAEMENHLLDVEWEILRRHRRRLEEDEGGEVGVHS